MGKILKRVDDFGCPAVELKACHRQFGLRCANHRHLAYEISVRVYAGEVKMAIK